MKVFLAVAVILAVAATGLGRPEEENIYNDEKIASFDREEVFSNERLLSGYADCFTGKGNCTPDGKNIKKVIPHAVEEECAKCSPQLRKITRKMIIAFRDKLPAKWEELLNTYDSKKQYRESLDKFLAQTD